MFFLHAPKLVLTGSSSSLRATGDRAAALGAEVVVVDSSTVGGGGPRLDVGHAPCVAELDGFDVALVAVADPASAGADLHGAAVQLAPALRHGALVIVRGVTVGAAEPDGRRFADELAELSGLDAGRHFDVVGLDGERVAWSTGETGAETARHLMSRLG